MKKIILTTICLVALLAASGQEPAFRWAKNMGGSAGYGRGTGVDASGNVYTAGFFTGTTDFDPGAGTFNLTSAGMADIFISKLDSNGNFVWAKVIGGASEDNALSVKVDASGNSYITGYFQGTVDFDPGAGTSNLTAAGSFDLFILKLNTSGNLVWAKRIGGTSDEQGNSITLDASGNVYTTGTFIGTVDFDPGAGTSNLTSAGTYDIFISKLDASGNFVWAKRMGGTNQEWANAIAIDASGNVYTTGPFNGTADFNPGGATFNLTPVGNSDMFVSKLDASGNFVWAKQIGGSLTESGYSIATDASGNVFTTGVFEGTVDFDPGAATFNLTTTGFNDIFISKLDASGNFAWAKKMGSSSDDSGQSITTDALGNVYTTGYFLFTVDFDPGAGTFNLTSTGGTDVFILKLNASGNFVWAVQSGAPFVHSIVLDPSENIYTTGYFTGTVDFDPGAGIFNLSSSGNPDIFVHKMRKCFPSASISPGGPTTFCSGGSVVLNANTGTAYQWKKDGNNISGATLSTYNATLAGDYTVIVTLSCGTATSSPVTVTVNSAPAAAITAGGPLTFCNGDFVILSANSGAGLTYQWRNNGVNISGATNSSYTANASGNYTCVVTGSCGSVLSNTITVTVNSAPQVSITSSNTGFCSGAASILSASSFPSGNSLQWYFNSSSISGATSSTYSASQPGAYYCRATSSCGSANSNEFNYYGTFPPVPVITPSGTIENCSGSYPVNLSVSPSSDVSYSSSHYWNRNSQQINPPFGTSPFISVSSPGNYYAIVQYSCGQSQSNNLNLKVLPAPSIPVDHGITYGCPGTGMYVAVNGFWNSYQWQKNGTDIPSAIGPNYDPSTPGYYRCRISNSCAYQYSDSVFIDIIQATITPSGPTTYCYGNPITLTGTTPPPGSAYNYSWYRTGVGWVSSDPSISTVNLLPGTYTFTVYITASYGCICCQPSASVVVTVLNSSANITPAGATTFCSGNSVILNANTGTGLTYQWKNTGTNISGATNSSYTATTSGSYTVVVTNTCGSATSSAVTVTVNPLPTASITPAGTTTFCTGGSVILNANTGSGLSYQWKIGGTNISGATNSSYTVNSSGSYTVVVTNSNNCSNTSSAVVVTVNPLPTVSFSGLASSYNVSAPAATLTGSPSGGTFSGPGISGNTFTPSVAGVGGPYTIIYSYTDANNCSNSSSQQTTVINCTVPTQPGTITVTGGNAKVCPGDSRTYTIPAVSGAASYTWTPPTGASITGGQGNTSITINFTAGFIAQGTLSVVANNACGSSTARTLTISRNNPSTPSVISGAAGGVCPGTSGTYSVTNAAGMTYNWTPPANASIVSGQGTNSVTVSFSASWVSGSLSVTATNNCSTSSARTLSILSKPATPTTIIGASNTVCAGTTGAYHVTNVAGVTFNWTAPANASIVSGQGTYSVSVSFSALFTSGSLTVSGTNGCGTSALRTLSISSIPAKPGTITGPGFNNCNVTSSYTIVAVLNATSYTWSTNIAGAVVTPNGTSASITFPTFTSGTVSVTSNNACGSSAAKTLTVRGTPATPASITGPTLVCANQFGVPYSIAAIPNATSYTWAGMTGSHISDGVVTSSGTTLTTTSISVTLNFGSTSGNLNVKANNACGAGSNRTLTIGFNCREDGVAGDNFDVKVYPNPSSGDFVFEIENAPGEKISINIIDAIGKMILADEFSGSRFTIRSSQWAAGMYSAQVQNGKKVKGIRIIKTE